MMKGKVIKMVSFIIGIFIGAMLGIFCMGLLTAQKENEMINETPKWIFCRTNDTSIDNIKIASTKLILTKDIEFYQKMYNINHNVYYLGRKEQSEFLLKIMEGKSEDEIR